VLTVTESLPLKTRYACDYSVIRTFKKWQTFSQSQPAVLNLWSLDHWHLPGGPQARSNIYLILRLKKICK